MTRIVNRHYLIDLLNQCYVDKKLIAIFVWRENAVSVNDV